jgi:hypothetical protein
VGRRGFSGGRGGRGSATTNAIANATTNVIANTPTNGIADTDGIASRGRPGGSANEQWPYCFKLTGTTPDDSVVH